MASPRTKTPSECDRCGAPLKSGRHVRIKSDRHSGENRPKAEWRTDEFRRYYCLMCAEEVKKAIRRCEMEGR